MNFGFLIDSNIVTFDDITIKPLADYRLILEKAHDELEIRNKWIYPPAGSGSIWFNLPCTHSIEQESNTIDEEHLKFLVLAYGFIHGRFLLPHGGIFFRRVPHSDRTLHPMIPVRNDREIGMHIINNFIQASEKKKNIFSMLHWFLVAGSYELAWDNFDANYKVLDCIFNLSEIGNCKNSVPHGRRPVLLAEKYDVPLPEWAVTDKKNKSELSRTRNSLVHEALFAGEPIGYKYPEENYRLQFANFNCKLICGLFGLKTSFISAPPDDPNPRIWKFEA